MVLPLTLLGEQVRYDIVPALSESRTTAAQPTGHGTTTRVTLIVRDSTIKYAIGELARQSRLQPIYDASPTLSRRISVHLVEMNVMDALAVVLHGTGLAAKVASDGETVMIRTMPAPAPVTGARGVDGTIVGWVTDSTTGASLNGVQVRVKGVAQLSTVTGDSGRFTLRNVPPGDQILQVRFFGYKMVDHPVTVTDSQRTIVHIVMVPVPTVLSGVVTTAAGIQRKVEVGNDITTLNVDSIMRVAPISTVTDLLETRVPGLTVLHTSGTPGDPARLRLRGDGSIQLNTDPVVIVDGIRVYANQSDARNNNLAPSVSGGSIYPNAGNGTATGTYSAPSPIDQIDPNNIATIEVLKGPSATATYGSDAANGVIIITTKHGRAGPTQWTLALAGGINWIPGSWPANPYRFGYTGVGQADVSAIHPNMQCPWYQVGCTIDSIVTFQALNDPRYTILSHGNDQQANLSISGGFPTLTYTLTGGGTADLGNLKLPAIEQQRYDSAYGPIPQYLVRPDRYQTWSVGGSVSAVPSATLRVTLQSTLFNSTQQQSSLQDAMTQLEGEYIGPSILLAGPLIVNDVERVTDNQLTSTNALSARWQARPWLPIDVTGGINTMQRTDETYIPFGVGDGGPGNPDNNSGDTTGSYGLGRGTSHNQSVSVGTSIAFPHTTLALGGNLYSQSTADFSILTNQLGPGVTTPTSFLCGDFTLRPCPSSQTTDGQNTYGLYVAPQIHVLGSLYLNPGFRLDGGNGTRSTVNNGLGGLTTFPKIDLSYLALDRQNSRPLWGTLTLLRPRVAFGYAGTQPSPADKLRLFNVGSAGYKLQTPDHGVLTSSTNNCQPTLTLDGINTVNAVCLNSLGNTQLRPERSIELEGGFDATLWRGRATLTYTQYNKTRHDAILSIPVAGSISGVNGTTFTYEKNIGVIRNTGTEATFNVFLLQQRAISWNVGANVSNDNNLVVRLNKGQRPIVLGETGGEERVTPGYPIFGLWARPIAGFSDMNHDGIIEPNEITYRDSAVYVGQPNPKYQFNLTTDLAILNGRLSLHATFAYQNGLTQDDQGVCTSGAFATLPNARNASLATQAAVVAAGCGVYNSVTDIGLIQTVNTFRFNDLSLNYVVPRSISTRLHAPQMSLALQGENLGLHTNYRGKDPDVNAFATVSAGDETADIGQLPSPRTWWVRVTLGN